MFLSGLFSNPILFFAYIGILIVIVSIHEYAHAYTADRLGDPTPGLAGRLTLNPKAHLDPLGSLLFLLIGFGWGRPVPFDPYNLKDPRKDAALISFAGPASNLVMASVGSVILYLFNFNDASNISTIGYSIVMLFIRLNIVLGVFNLLPFAPLDGFKIVGGLLSEKQAQDWYGLERYGTIFLLFFILPFMGERSMLDIFISPVIAFLTGILIP